MVFCLMRACVQACPNALLAAWCVRVGDAQWRGNQSREILIEYVFSCAMFSRTQRIEHEIWICHLRGLGWYANRAHYLMCVPGVCVCVRVRVRCFGVNELRARARTPPARMFA